MLAAVEALVPDLRRVVAAAPDLLAPQVRGSACAPVHIYTCTH